MRSVGLARALAPHGHHIRLISLSGPQAQPDATTAALLDGHAEVDYVAPRAHPRRTTAGRWRGLPRRERALWLGDNRIGDALREFDPDLVMGQSAAPWILHQVARAAPRCRARLIDLVDWHDEDFVRRGGRDRVVAMRYSMEVALPRMRSLLVISRFMEDYYSARGVMTLRVPPLFDPAAGALAEPAPLDRDRLNVTIAGTAPRLDRNYLRNTLNAAAALNAAGKPVTVHILGHPPAFVRNLDGLAVGALDAAQCHGWVTYAQLLGLVQASDFTVHQRPMGPRWSAAQFPSKVVESWSLGTPVITNLTSDLELYAEGGRNVVLLDSDDVAAMAAGLSRAWETRGDFDHEGIAAWAGEELSPAAYGDCLDAFLREAAGRA
jgi:glycosyltransferase involved in cell wall biosynthesis